MHFFYRTKESITVIIYCNIFLYDVFRYSLTFFTFVNETSFNLVFSCFFNFLHLSISSKILSSKTLPNLGVVILLIVYFFNVLHFFISLIVFFFFLIIFLFYLRIYDQYYKSTFYYEVR